MADSSNNHHDHPDPTLSENRISPERECIISIAYSRGDKGKPLTQPRISQPTLKLLKIGFLHDHSIAEE